MDAQETAEGQVAETPNDEPKRTRTSPGRARRIGLGGSLFIHASALVGIGLLLEGRALTPIPERDMGKIKITRPPEPIEEPPPIEEEPPVEIEEEVIESEPELVEVPFVPPEEPPEVLPVVEPIDWIPPADPVSPLAMFKQAKPKPEPQPMVVEPEVVPELPIEPPPPTYQTGKDIPVPSKSPTPIYSRKAQRLGWQGTVVLRAKVNAAGTVIHVVVHRSSGHADLDESALRAFRKWEFAPRKAGEPDVRLLEKPFTFKKRS